MSSIKHPVGPQPPSVYWRRRLLLALGLLAVIIVIVLIVVRPGAGGTDPSATDDPGSSTSDDPDAGASDEPAEEADPGGPCDPGVITLEAVTDLDSYPAGQQPQVSMTITNVGSVECTIDADPALQEYVITSGADRIWSSKDCAQLTAAPAETLLLPNTPQTTAPGPWPLVRSAEGCPADQPAAIGGGATYRLTVSLGEVESAPTTFLLG